MRMEQNSGLISRDKCTLVKEIELSMGLNLKFCICSAAEENYYDVLWRMNLIFINFMVLALKSLSNVATAHKS